MGTVVQLSMKLRKLWPCLEVNIELDFQSASIDGLRSLTPRCVAHGTLPCLMEAESYLWFCSVKVYSVIWLYCLKL